MFIVCVFLSIVCLFFCLKYYFSLNYVVYKTKHCSHHKIKMFLYVLLTYPLSVVCLFNSLPHNQLKMLKNEVKKNLLCHQIGPLNIYLHNNLVFHHLLLNKFLLLILLLHYSPLIVLKTYVLFFIFVNFCIIISIYI